MFQSHRNAIKPRNLTAFEVNMCRTALCSSVSFMLIVVGVLTVSGSSDPNKKPREVENGTCCSQEMCVFLFDQIEEQSIRWRNIEEALRRVVAILASNEYHKSTSVIDALKKDPLLGSLLLPQRYETIDTLASPLTGWEVEPPSLMISRFEIETAAPDAVRNKRQTNGLSNSAGGNLDEDFLLEDTALHKESLKDSELNPHATVDATQAASRVSIIEGTDPSLIVKSRVPRDVEGQATLPGIINGIDTNNSTTQPMTSTSNSELTTQPRTSNSNSEPTTQPWTSDANNELIQATTIAPVTISATQQYVKEAVSTLQGALKCALAQIDETSLAGRIGLITDASAKLNPNSTLTIQFDMKTCLKHWVAVWIRISTNNEHLQNWKATVIRDFENSDIQLLQIPRHCLKKKGTSFTINLPITPAGNCSFLLKKLVECQIYNIEFIPVFLTIQGYSSSVRVTVPPQIGRNSTDLTSLEAISVTNSTHMLALKWSVQSESCAHLLTSVSLNIYEDTSDVALRSFSVPQDCVATATLNSFSTSLSSWSNDSSVCPSVTWVPLDVCRNYKMEVYPEYVALLKGKPSAIEIFTSGGSSSSRCCNMLTATMGSFQSQNYDGKFACTWLISVPKNNTIWLTFTQLQVESYYYRVKVYDGPYSNSRLLLELYGSQPPSAIRSRTNSLFVELVSTYYHPQQSGKSFIAHYMTIPDVRVPYVSGCGGYIIGSGTISKPSYPSTENSSSLCDWYLRASENSSILISSSTGTIPFPMIVYDGWSSNRPVVFNLSERETALTYTPGSLSLLRFPQWNSAERDNDYAWTIYSVKMEPACTYNLTSTSGSIRSPGYPSRYPTLIDCRWKISVNSTSKIRLTFAYLETQKGYDFVTIYDGASIYSPTLLELSGSVENAQSVTSSSNEIFVRFTSSPSSGVSNYNDNYYLYQGLEGTTASYNNGESNKNPSLGFLAVYATIPCK